METGILMGLMLEMEKLLQHKDCATAYTILLEAEECLLRMQREALAVQAEILRRVA